MGRSASAGIKGGAVAVASCAGSVTQDPTALAEAYATADSLDAEDVAARAAQALAPTMRDTGGLTAVGEAVRAHDRPAAAGSLPVFEDLRWSADDELLSGLNEAFAAMAAATLGVDRAEDADVPQGDLAHLSVKTAVPSLGEGVPSRPSKVGLPPVSKTSQITIAPDINHSTVDHGRARVPEQPGDPAAQGIPLSGRR